MREYRIVNPFEAPAGAGRKSIIRLSVRPSVLWLIVAGSVALQAQEAARFLDEAAREQLQRSQAAILGALSPAAPGTTGQLRGLVLKGRLRVGVSRDASVDGQVEIRVLLPDRYLRVDTVNGVDRRSGFSGRTLLTPKGAIAVERAAFARLMLGLVAYVPDAPKLSFQTTAETAFADTVAVDIEGGPGLSARMVFDGPSHVPLRLVYDSRYGAGTVMSFANRREVDGVQLPARVTTLIAERVLETLMFDDMRVNPDLNEGDFRK